MAMLSRTITGYLLKNSWEAVSLRISYSARLVYKTALILVQFFPILGIDFCAKMYLKKQLGIVRAHRQLE
jgi:hypothetical protein